jgi:hypothetical protein
VSFLKFIQTPTKNRIFLVFFSQKNGMADLFKMVEIWSIFSNFLLQKHILIFLHIRVDILVKKIKKKKLPSENIQNGR